jgi:predicted TIM-barrel fold metal-dependent hydrolase
MKPLIDTNIYLSRWPFRRLPGDELKTLVETLQHNDITQAWAGSFDSLLHHDIASVNERLVESCRDYGNGLLLPIGTINPLLPDWQEDLRRCHEVHKMRGIRLHPNYHRYKLDSPLFALLLQQAVERGLIVQLALTMEDERTQHPLVQVPHVNTSPLVALARDLPQMRLQLLGAFRSIRPLAAAELAAAGNIFFEISMLEGVGGVEQLLKHVPLERVLFGSHAPLFYVESAILKMQESVLPNFQQVAICQMNAQRLLAGEK